MAKNEDGEVELVLGSKVLMGVFFLGAVLLGLSFLMGYVVGKGAAPVLTAQQAPREKNEPVAAITSPPVVEVPQSKPEPEPIKTAPQAPAETSPKESEPPKVAPDTHTADAEKAAREQAEKQKADRAREEKLKADKAVADRAKAEKAKADQAKVEQAKVDRAKADKQAKTDKAKADKDKAQAEHAKADKAKAKAEPAKAVAQTASPAKGRTYLQLSATGKDEAESLATLLKSRGFASTTAQIPEKPTLFRVLVGPITPADAARTRADLKAKSFAGADEAIIKAF